MHRPQLRRIYFAANAGQLMGNAPIRQPKRVLPFFGPLLGYRPNNGLRSASY